MARKAKGPEPRERGQVIPKGDRKWLVRVYLGRNEAGQRKYSSKTIEGTAKQAEQALTKMLGSVDVGTFVEPSKLTLCEYLTGYKLPSDAMAAFKKDGHAAFRGWLGGRKVALGPKTYQSYGDRLRKDILPALGHRRLDSITRADVQALVGDLSATRGLSRATIRQSLVVLGAALEQAVVDGILAKNATKHVELPKAEHKESTVLSPEQIRTFLEKAEGSPRYALWTLLLQTAVRPQEALALQWGDLGPMTLLDGEGKPQTVEALTIQRAMVEVEPGVYAVGPLKTEASFRNITLPDATAAVLKAHRAKQAADIMKAGSAYRRQGFIFAGRNGDPLDLSALRRRWTRELVEAGLPPVRLYDARHSHLTALLSAGMSPKAVAARGGHSVDVLMSTYAHVLESQQLQAATITGSLLTRRQATG